MKNKFRENSTWLNLGGRDIDKTVMINMTECCNLNCVYCYEHNKQGRDLDMGRVTSKLDKILTDLKIKKKISIQFSGGEPLLCFDEIREIYDYVYRKYICNHEWETHFCFGMTTNGTLLTAEMAEWFDQHPSFSFSLSLDGTPEAHNRNRSGSYAAVKRNLDFFRRHKKPAKMTVSPQTISDCAAGIKHIHSLGFESTCNMVFEDVWGDVVEQKRYLQVFAEQLSELIDFYSDKPELPRTTLIRPLIESLPRDKNIQPQRYCGGGTRMILIDVDGKDYPCHRFAPLSSKRKFEKINFNKISVKPKKCADCELLAMCPTCYGYNYEYYGDLDRKTTFHCEFFKLQARSAAILTFKDIERIKNQVGLHNLSNDEKVILNRRIQSALFVEEYTRPLYESLFA